VALNFSLGLLVAVPVSQRWSLYAGGGGGGAFAILGENDNGASSAALGYYHGRVGAAVRLGVEQRDQLGIDGGFWRGQYTHDDGEHSDRHAFLLPVAGLSWFHAL
jgi:hypothetical protein